MTDKEITKKQLDDALFTLGFLCAQLTEESVKETFPFDWGRALDAQQLIIKFVEDGVDLCLAPDSKENDELNDERYFKNNFTVRTQNCLAHCDILTIKDLLCYSAAELHKIPNLGKKSVREIEEALAKLNLRLPLRAIKNIYDFL